MSHFNNGQEQFARMLLDASERSRKNGRPYLTGFLSLHQQDQAAAILKNRDYVLDGGTANAERKRLIFGDPKEAAVCCVKAAVDPNQKPVRHPDLLGALMHAGIERSVLGDLACTETEVYVCTTLVMADYICQSVCMIGHQMVSFEPCTLEEMPAVQLEEKKVNTASLRADAIVAALSGCARSKAMNLISAGFVKVNDTILDRNVQLCNNDIISVRRCGRFRFAGVENTTRKGRLVLTFYKYQ